MEKYNKLIGPNPLFEMVHISMDEDVKSATQWAAKESFPWLTILPEAKPEGVMSYYPEEGVPEYMLVDTAGKIVLVAPGEQVFEKMTELANTAK
ncbi:MAG: TlpA family protein disulfide reductase [Roseibacillus sp.]